MKINVKSKFDVGETVRVKGSDTYLVINNVIAEGCSAGLQIVYKGIVTFKTHGYKGGRTVDPACRMAGFNESVLESIPKEI